MDDSKQDQLRIFSLRKLPKVVKGKLADFMRYIQRFVVALFSIISALTSFLAACVTAMYNVYEGATGFIFYIVRWLRELVHFDYKGSLTWAIGLPRECYSQCKEETRKYIWLPIACSLKTRMNRVSQATHAMLHETVIYARGFRELGRRLFLLASDYAPGGKITVTIFLVSVTFVIFFKILTIAEVLVQIAQVVFNIASFLLHPLWLTLQDILSLFHPLTQVIDVLLRAILHGVVSSFTVIGTFIWLNVVSISSGLYRFWHRFANSTIVKFVWTRVWRILKSTSYFLSEKFVFVFLPFISKTSYHLASLSFDISSVAYENFFVVNVTVDDKFEYFTPAGLGSCILVLWAMLVAFWFRNTFTGTFFSEIDDKEYAITRTVQTTAPHKRTTQKKEASTRICQGGKSINKKDNPLAEDNTNGHIRYSPQVPICSDHIFGNCNHGNKCDNHHCPLPYHWQYRPSLDGWKSFSAQDNCRIEELFCDPSKDIVNASEIEAVFESYRRERGAISLSKNPAKVDFENMRIERNHKRADLRRLSTESYVRQKEEKRPSLLTHWVWYRKEESGEWVKYGGEGESGAIQEDLESAFLRRDGNFTVVRDGKEFRLQFFMNPMCEKSFRPYSRKHVRRRPQFKSPEEIQLLTRSTTKTKRSWFKIFWWG